MVFRRLCTNIVAAPAVALILKRPSWNDKALFFGSVDFCQDVKELVVFSVIFASAKIGFFSKVKSDICCLLSLTKFDASAVSLLKFTSSVESFELHV